MRDFFNPENPLMIFFARLTDLIILNLVCIICCLPIVTIGASVTALHYVTLKMAKNEEGYIIKSFFKSFKENLKQSTVVWLLFLVITLFFYLDMRIIKYGGLDIPKGINMVIYGTYFICCIVMMYTLPLLARFSNTIKGTLKNASLMSILHFGKTILMAIIYLLPVMLTRLHYDFAAVYLLFGLSAPAYVNGFFWKSIFKRYEPQEEEETEESEGFVHTWEEE